MHQHRTPQVTITQVRDSTSRIYRVEYEDGCWAEFLDPPAGDMNYHWGIPYWPFPDRLAAQAHAIAARKRQAQRYMHEIDTHDSRI